MNILYYVYWGYTLLVSIVITMASFYYIKYLQNHAYSAVSYCAWIKKRFTVDWLMLLLSGVIALMLKICNVFFIKQIPILAYICFYGADAVFLYLMISMYLSYKKTCEGDPLVIKGPAIFMIVVIFAVTFLCEANLMRETKYYGSVPWLQYLTPYFIGYLPAMVLPLITLLAFMLTSPRLAFQKQAPSVPFYADDEAKDELEAQNITGMENTDPAKENQSANNADTENKGENQ